MHLSVDREENRITRFSWHKNKNISVWFLFLAWNNQLSRMESQMFDRNSIVLDWGNLQTYFNDILMLLHSKVCEKCGANNKFRVLVIHKNPQLDFYFELAICNWSRPTIHTYFRIKDALGFFEIFSSHQKLNIEQNIVLNLQANYLVVHIGMRLIFTYNKLAINYIGCWLCSMWI